MALWGLIRLVRGVGPAPSPLPPRAVAFAATFLIGGLALATGLQPAAATLKVQPTTPTTPNVHGRDVGPGDEAQVNEAFMQFAEGVMKPTDAFIVEAPANSGAGPVSWLEARLEPRPDFDDVAKADWVVFLNTAPTSVVDGRKLDQMKWFDGMNAVGHFAPAG